MSKIPNKFFNLPSVIKGLIYEFDNTYKEIYNKSLQTILERTACWDIRYGFIYRSNDNMDRCEYMLERKLIPLENTLIQDLLGNISYSPLPLPLPLPSPPPPPITSYLGFIDLLAIELSITIDIPIATPEPQKKIKKKRHTRRKQLRNKYPIKKFRQMKQLKNRNKFKGR